MKKKLQIFISSTYTDLIEERQAAVSAILKAGHIPAGMELFTAGDESQMETIKRWINESDVFMLILGGRYGSVEPTKSLSYTELEYDYAVQSGKPLFAVVIDEEALDRKVKDKGVGVIEKEHPRELKAFREKVLSKMSAFFKDAPEIKLAVYETIPDLINKHDFKGWVSGNEIPDIQSFTDQINKLREENSRLAEEKEALNKGEFFTPSEEREFNHIRQKLDRNINLHFELFQQKEGEKSGTKIAEVVYEVNLLSSIIDFIGKGEHQFNISHIEYRLYKRFNESHPLTDTPEITMPRNLESIKENLILELQTYGLDRVISADMHRPWRSTCEFTEKMYRFRYWLDYNRYVPEINFELISRTDVDIPVLSPPKEEIPALQTIKEIDREVNFKSQRNKWHTTEEGVMSAQDEFEKLCEELERKVSKSNRESETFNINFSREGHNHCKVSGVGINLSATWNCGRPDTLVDSFLSVSGNQTRFVMEGVQSFTEEQDKFYDHVFDIDMSRNLKVVWQRREEKVSFTTNELATALLTDLVKAIRKRVANGR